MDKQKRISVYISENDHRKMKGELARQGMTISEWIRSCILKFVHQIEGKED